MAQDHVFEPAQMAVICEGILIMAGDENEFLDLPDDPEEAFLILEKRKYSELSDLWQSSQDFRYEREYVNVMLAFDEVYDLGFLSKYGDVPDDDALFSTYIHGFKSHINRVKQKLLVEAARKVKNGTTGLVTLDTPARSAIHQLIQTIREKLNHLNLPENKREALFGKLNAFAAEIDRNRTRTEAFYSFAIDAARAAREVNDEIKPLQDTIDRVFDWLDKATKWKDSLPPWQDRKKIEGPKKQLSGPADDHSPF